jgi:hypothetical protein
LFFVAIFSPTFLAHHIFIITSSSPPPHLPQTIILHLAGGAPPPRANPPTPRTFGAPPPGFAKPPTAQPPTPSNNLAPPPTATIPSPAASTTPAFNPMNFRPAAPAPVAPNVPPTPGGSRPALTTPVPKQLAWYSIFALGEHLIDHLLSHGLKTPKLFSDKGYAPQVDTLFTFVSPANTYSPGAHGAHLHAILPQLSTEYLNDFSPLAIAEVLRKWVKEVKIFPQIKITRALQIASFPDPNERCSGIKELLEGCDSSTQSFIAHILQMCNILWANEKTTELSKSILAYTFGPLLFPIETVTMSSQTEMKNANRLVEDMIQNVNTVASKGLSILQSNKY